MQLSEMVFRFGRFPAAATAANNPCRKTQVCAIHPVLRPHRRQSHFLCSPAQAHRHEVISQYDREWVYMDQVVEQFSPIADFRIFHTLRAPAQSGPANDAIASLPAD